MPRQLAGPLAFVFALVASSMARADPPAEGSARAPASLTPIVRRLVGPEATHESCRPLADVRGEQRYACSITECPGACQVVHVEVVIGVRRGRGRVVSRVRRRVGDTGECGCCMEAF
jgi:hypothetical protein